jgi:hypothetical protein
MEALVSPLRTTMLVFASLLTLLSGIVLGDVMNGGQTIPDSLVVATTCAALAAWISFVAITDHDHLSRHMDDTEARIGERFDALSARLDDISDQVGEYGDQRETTGYLAHARDSGGGHLSRVK